MGDQDESTAGEVVEQDEHGSDPRGGSRDRAADPDPVDAMTQSARDEVMDLLAVHVPLALLADLAAPSSVGSAEILESEGLPADAWWEAQEDAGTADDEGAQQA